MIKVDVTLNQTVVEVREYNDVRVSINDTETKTDLETLCEFLKTKSNEASKKIHILSEVEEKYEGISTLEFKEFLRFFQKLNHRVSFSIGTNESSINP